MTRIPAEIVKAIVEEVNAMSDAEVVAELRRLGYDPDELTRRFIFAAEEGQRLYWATLCERDNGNTPTEASSKSV